MQPGADGYAGPVIVDLGMAGMGNRFAHQRASGVSVIVIYSQNIESPQPAIFVYVNDDTHGYMTLAANTTSLSMTYVSGLDAVVLDQFTLSKSH